LTIALPQKSLAQTRKTLPRASKSAAASSTVISDEEEYLTSNSLEYEEDSDSGSEFEQGSDEDSARISDIGSEDGESPPPSRPALKKTKSKQSKVSSDEEELEQAMFEAAMKESRRTALQEHKLGQSSTAAGSSKAAAPSLPDFDNDDMSEQSEDDIPLRLIRKGKTRGKGKATADWDDWDAESESWKVPGEFDAPELSTNEKKALANGTHPVKIHQRAMARKLGRKLTYASLFGFSQSGQSNIFSGREDVSCASVQSP
jgi:hypothetical protein